MKKVISIAALLAMGTAFVNAEVSVQEINYVDLDAALKTGDLENISGVTVFYGSGGGSKRTLLEDENTIKFEGNVSDFGALFKDVFYIAIPNVSRYEQIKINFNITGSQSLSYEYNLTQPKNDFTPRPVEGIDDLYRSETMTTTGENVVVLLPSDMYEYYVGFDGEGSNIPAGTVLFALCFGNGEAAAVTISNIGVLTSAIPEPSAFGLLAGLGALALVGTRRRRK